MDAITVSTDDLPANGDQPVVEELKGFSHSEIAALTRLKLSTISPYFSRGRIAQGNGHAFKPNKKTMLWDEIEP